MNQLADMHYARASHGICLNRKFVYVCGGRDESENPQKTFERYDTAMNTWEKLPECVIPAIRPLLVTLNDNYVFKLGGITADQLSCNTIERFDISKNEWSVVSYIVKEESKNLKSSGFAFHPMMSGVQISHNSIMVLFE